jgi:uncharacterized protein (DUF58 family)
MDAKELLNKVRRIEIKSRRLSDHLFSGEYQSSFKGRGMSFSEVREYQFGDDVRAIDWNVTAKFNSPYVKVFEEERERTVVLLVDISNSEFFGTKSQTKSDMIAEICAVLSFSATQNNDKVGVLFFSDKVEKFIPPKKGKRHILRIIRELIDLKPESNGTNISEALVYISNMLKKKAIIFLLSDFLDDGYHEAMSFLSRRHELTNIRLFDIHEQTLPYIGLVRMKDAESGALKWINTSSKKSQKKYADWHEKRYKYFKDSSIRSGSGMIDIRTDESYVNKLLGYFKRK